MSNPYLNNILFGNSKTQVNEDYIRGLEQYMLTADRLQHIPKDEPQVPTVALATEDAKPPQIEQKAPEPRRRQKNNSLFWSIYEIENPKEAFLGTRANAEVEHRLKVVASLKLTPKRLKETNSKLTIERTQALLGAMLVAKEDNIDFCIAYAVYYCKPIVVVYPTTYRVFSPMVDVDLVDDVILLYASKPESARTVLYESEKNATPELIAKIVESRVRIPLAAQSTYKAQELDEIAAKLHIATNSESASGKEKRRKKEDIYNDILVATHNDANFLRQTQLQ
jgi:hypothetical protein